MYTINRSAAVVRPKPPFLNWLNSLPDQEELTLEQISEECTTILVPGHETAEQSWAYIENIYRHIFDFELGGWCRDKRFFPKDRTYKMFREWFEVQINSEVFDMCNTPVIREPV
jgi:hypothetical protein